MLSRQHSLRAMPMFALILSGLTACGSMPSAEPPPTARRPRPAPLPAAILQIDTQPSTRTLSEGRQWLQDSEVILQEGMQR